ncbi:MAG TPA: FAD-dependent oxidoreductase [Candidatus Limnocylindrales bacterium]|nr:FAD-dependent oxidoreductase [Candidatus Limnocylindrales bacterium]
MRRPAAATPDVAVIGGGIAGSATAALLADRGLRVRLYERSAIAAGASGRNSGIVQHPFDAVLAELHQRSLLEYAALTERLGGAFSLPAEPAGLLLVGRDRDAARAEAARWAERWPATSPAVLEGAELAALEPSLAPDLVACRLAIGYQVAPSAATRAYATLARRLGVEVVIGQEASAAVVSGRVVGVRVAGEVEPAGQVVVAAGPWTPAVIDPSGRWRPVRPVWGVVATLDLPDGPRHSLEAIDIGVEPGDARGDLDVPVLPADSGRSPTARDEDVAFSLVRGPAATALGSTFLETEPEPAAWLDALRRVGTRYVPSIAGATIAGHRHCARPTTDDGRPLLGPAPWADGLWVIAGHGPWGISTGPGSARLLVDALLGGPAAIPSALDVGRFGAP